MSERGGVWSSVARIYGSVRGASYHTPTDVWDHWVELFQQRIRDQWHSVVVLTGEPGAGKSTCAFRLARAIEPEFQVDQAAYSAEDMLRLYGSLERGQVAVYDEAVLGLLSNDFYTQESRELLKAVNIVRAKGITVLLCIPELTRLVAGWREEAVRFWIYCRSEPRGVGTMHVRPIKPHYQRHATQGVGLYQDEEWNPIRWRSLDGTPFWKRYQAAKLERIDQFMRESRERLSAMGPGGKDREARYRRLERLLDEGYTQDEARSLEGCGFREVAEAARRRAERPSATTTA